MSDRKRKTPEETIKWLITGSRYAKKEREITKQDADDCKRRKTPEEIIEQDATDLETHPMKASDGATVYHFALGGSSAQIKTLECFFQEEEPHSRYQISLCCPLCKSGLGMYIYPKNGIQALSENQQRKNRNTMLFGKSHMKRTHSNLESRLVPVTEAFEQSVTPAADVAPKRYRAGPAKSSKSAAPATAMSRPSKSPSPVIKRKIQHEVPSVAANVATKQFRAGPATSSAPATSELSVSQTTGVKRKIQHEAPRELVLKRSLIIPIEHSQASISKDAPGLSSRQCKPSTPAQSAKLKRIQTNSRQHKYTPEGLYIDEEKVIHYDKPKGWCPDDGDVDEDCDSSEYC